MLDSPLQPVQEFSGPDPGRRRDFFVEPVVPSTRALARRLVATEPALAIHIASLLENEHRSLSGMWLLHDDERAVGVIQARRGFSFWIDPSVSSDSGVEHVLGRFLERAIDRAEVVFGPEPILSRVLARAGRLPKLIEDSRPQVFMVAGEDLRAASEVARPPAATLRAARRSDLRWLLRAHGAMCREDLGTDQVARNPSGYREYFRGMIDAGRSWIGTLGSQRMFKLETPVHSSAARLVEGVYTDPAYRGLGFATWALARLALESASEHRQLSLYVNDENRAARAIYRRIGMSVISRWRTVLLARQTLMTRPTRTISLGTWSP